MKNFLTVLVLFLFLIPSKAQVQKERRVYYLDCSYSMVTNKIWKPVCENLKKAIDNVSDETTELVVVLFALDSKGGVKAFSEKATNAGKSALKSKIDGIEPSKSSMTYHSVPWDDFVKNRVAQDKVTYLFFMTDGLNEEKPDPMLAKIGNWGAQYGDKNVYGFYVMLHGQAKSKTIEQIIDNQPHLWKVETADININLIRLDAKAIFNIRNEKYVDIPIFGNTAKLSFSCVITGNTDYKVTKTEKLDGKLRVHIKSTQAIASLPDKVNCKLSVVMSGADKYTFLLTDSVDLSCVNKKEYSLKVTVK